MRQGPTTWKAVKGSFLPLSTPSSTYQAEAEPLRTPSAPGHRPCGDTVSAQIHRRRQSGTEVRTMGLRGRPPPVAHAPVEQPGPRGRCPIAHYTRASH